MLPAVTVEPEASQMLEAALEQMDDIIAGKNLNVLELLEITACRDNAGYKMLAKKKHLGQIIYYLNVNQLQLYWTVFVLAEV